jgi:hypothetical protein
VQSHHHTDKFTNRKSGFSGLNLCEQNIIDAKPEQEAK